MTTRPARSDGPIDLFDELGEVRRIEECRLGRVGMTVALGGADQVAAEERARQPGPRDTPAEVAQVFLEATNVGRTAGPVDPLEHEQDARRAMGARPGGRDRRHLRRHAARSNGATAERTASTRVAAPAARVEHDRPSRPRPRRRIGEKAVIGRHQAFEECAVCPGHGLRPHRRRSGRQGAGQGRGRLLPMEQDRGRDAG